MSRSKEEAAYRLARKTLKKAGLTHWAVNGHHDVLNCQHCILLPHLYEAITTHADQILDAIYDAAKVDQPDEGKHELAVRIMRMIRGG